MNNEYISSRLEAMLKVINTLEVRGRQNCLVIISCINEIEDLMKKTREDVEKDASEH